MRWDNLTTSYYGRYPLKRCGLFAGYRGSFILKVVSGASGCNVSRKYQLNLLIKEKSGVYVYISLFR